MAKHIVSLMVALVMAGLVWAGPAAAESTRPLAKKRALFRTLDRNKDGRLSRAEFLAMWHHQKAGSGLFRRLDADKDGSLTYQEFRRPWGRSFPARHLNRRHVFRSLDADQNGSLTPRELASFFTDPARAAAYFKRLDRDRDHRVSWNEFGQGHDTPAMINILRW